MADSLQSQKGLQNFIQEPSEFYARPSEFCANCGKSRVSNAKYCHNCGSKVSESNAKEVSTPKENGESSGGDAKVTETTSGRMSFAQFRAHKEEDRAKHFTKKNGKRFKLDIKDVIKNEEKKFYCLLYADKTKAESLPGSDEPFTLQRYKEEIGKPYSKIVLYLCRWAEYYSARLNELYSSGNENSDADESVEKQVENKDSSQT
ncbi:Hypothetical predicted protein, partial [Paramuricea clavata]